MFFGVHGTWVSPETVYGLISDVIWCHCKHKSSFMSASERRSVETSRPWIWSFDHNTTKSYLSVLYANYEFGVHYCIAVPMPDQSIKYSDFSLKREHFFFYNQTQMSCKNGSNPSSLPCLAAIPHDVNAARAAFKSCRTEEVRWWSWFFGTERRGDAHGTRVR